MPSAGCYLQLMKHRKRRGRAKAEQGLSVSLVFQHPKQPCWLSRPVSLGLFFTILCLVAGAVWWWWGHGAVGTRTEGQLIGAVYPHFWGGMMRGRCVFLAFSLEGIWED